MTMFGINNSNTQNLRTCADVREFFSGELSLAQARLSRLQERLRNQRGETARISEILDRALQENPPPIQAEEVEQDEYEGQEEGLGGLLGSAYFVVYNERQSLLSRNRDASRLNETIIGEEMEKTRSQIGYLTGVIAQTNEDGNGYCMAVPRPEPNSR